MPKAQVLNDFIQNIEAIVAAERDQLKIVTRLELLVKQLVASNDLGWLKNKYRQPPLAKSGVAAGYGQYLPLPAGHVRYTTLDHP